MKTRYGNFMQNPFLFDSELFGISRREARSMDPQQRVLLQTAYRARRQPFICPRHVWVLGPAGAEAAAVVQWWWRCRRG